MKNGLSLIRCIWKVISMCKEPWPTAVHIIWRRQKYSILFCIRLHQRTFPILSIYVFVFSVICRFHSSPIHTMRAFCSLRTIQLERATRRNWHSSIVILKLECGWKKRKKKTRRWSGANWKKTKQNAHTKCIRWKIVWREIHRFTPQQFTLFSWYTIRLVTGSLNTISFSSPPRAAHTTIKLISTLLYFFFAAAASSSSSSLFISMASTNVAYWPHYYNPRAKNWKKKKTMIFFFEYKKAVLLTLTLSRFRATRESRHSSLKIALASPWKYNWSAIWVFLFFFF